MKLLITCDFHHITTTRKYLFVVKAIFSLCFNFICTAKFYFKVFSFARVFLKGVKHFQIIMYLILAGRSCAACKFSTTSHSTCTLRPSSTDVPAVPSRSCTHRIPLAIWLVLFYFVCRKQLCLALHINTNTQCHS